MTLDDLRKIAEAATKGPWDYQPWSTYALPSGDYAESILLASAAEDGEIVRGPRDEDGEFFATFNPSKVLELLARLAAVEKLHPNIHGECHTCSNENGPLNWPCPTIKAARGE